MIPQWKVPNVNVTSANSVTLMYTSGVTIWHMDKLAKSIIDNYLRKKSSSIGPEVSILEMVLGMIPQIQLRLGLITDIQLLTFADTT